jgi:anti-sigma-K factor RskA
LIEAYVSGLATSNEIQVLEGGMTQFPEVAAAVDDCHLDMEQYIMLQAKTPPSEVKYRLLQIITDEEIARENGTFTEEQEVVEKPVRPKVYVRGYWRWATAAAVLLLLGSVYLNYMYFGQYNEYKGRYEAVMSAKNSLAEESNLYRARMERMEQSLKIVEDPAMRAIRMAGTKSFPTALATVYWNQQEKEVFVLINNLPAPTPDKQYQLWAIVKGKPVSMGLLETGKNKDELFQKMKFISNAEMFAVTLEEKGGSASPDLDQMYVAGYVPVKAS